MTEHRKFLNELRSPVRNYNRKMREQRQKKIDVPQVADMSTEDNDALMKELEAKFDELFGSNNDE